MQGQVYGFPIMPTNFTSEIRGYFLAPATGWNYVDMTGIDDSAVLQVGNGVAFDCCNQNAQPIGSSEFTINGIKRWKGALGNAGSWVYL